MQEEVAARTMRGPVSAARIEYTMQRLQDQRPGYKLEVMKLLDDVHREWKQLEALAERFTPHQQPDREDAPMAGEEGRD